MNELQARVCSEIQAPLFPGANLLLGLSGGVDSIVLLALLSQAATTMRFSLRAVHVHHGLSPRAAEWAGFCAARCAQSRVPLSIERVDVSEFRHLGPEGAARMARYGAFARHPADFLVLAQHRDDQAETLLLQLMRGAGPAGLAGMAPWRAADAHSAFRHGVLRPMLSISRADILDYARTHGLAWVEDESNERLALDRNFVRLRVIPLLEERYPHAREVAARSARHLAEAAQLLEALAAEDLERLCSGAPPDAGDGLDIRALCALGTARAKNALRHYCRRAGITPPGAARLDDLWAQLTGARPDAAPRMELSGGVILRYRDRLHLERPSPRRVRRPFEAVWNGEPVLPLLELDGVLRFAPEEGRGASVAKLRAQPVAIRLRKGGERLQPHEGRPRRTLKNLLRERGVPPWRRARLPLLFCGETLALVPGVAVDCAFRALPGERGLIVTWEPAGRAAGAAPGLWKDSEAKRNLP
ncbi:MAG: tRNA lysidine(34) synthetase TilS [Burkholderiales bacterium]|nr:tRNA lysidine(34) synthetase TilS [Burkholderiales bacterium]